MLALIYVLIEKCKTRKNVNDPNLSSVFFKRLSDAPTI